MRNLCVVPTPDRVKTFMISLAAPLLSPSSVLEVACGDAPFLSAFAERYGKSHRLVGVEILPELVELARKKVPYATIIEKDFLLWETSDRFDIIIGNPPYGIVGTAQHYARYNADKSLYKSRSKVWKGQFNIYGAFIERAICLLSPGGKLVFVVPSGWMTLDSFSLLRQLLAREGRIDVYYLGRVFPRKGVNAVVMVLQSGEKGMRLFSPDTSEPVVAKEDYTGEIIRFETPETIELEQQGVAIGDIFDIRIAPRSGELHSHPLVEHKPRTGLVHFLTGRNLKPMHIDYDTCYSNLWMSPEAVSSLRSFFGIPHIVVGNTKGAKLVAAYDYQCYPWREEYHLVPKKPVNEMAILEYLNGPQIQHYIRTLYRDVTRLTSTMLRLVPIPPHLLG